MPTQHVSAVSTSPPTSGTTRSAEAVAAIVVFAVAVAIAILLRSMLSVFC